MIKYRILKTNRIGFIKDLIGMKIIIAKIIAITQGYNFDIKNMGKK